jgi:hypothetical protein
MAENGLGIASISPVGSLGPIAPLATIPGLPAPGAGSGKVTAVDVGGYWINHYKRCGQTECDYCNLEAAGFSAAMHLNGHRVSVMRGNQDASPVQWSAATDQKPNGIDTVEFAYLASHGGTHGKELRNSKYLHWFLTTFDSPAGCFVSTIVLDANTWKPRDAQKPVTAMRLGEGRLRWVVIDACRSLQIRLENERDQHDQNLVQELSEANPGETWGRCYAGVHMLFGFTGLSSDASWTRERGISFGRRAGRGEALADSWLDEAYSYWVGDVPAVTAFGQSAQEVEQRIKGESLKAVGSPATTPIQNYYYKTMWRS